MPSIKPVSLDGSTLEGGGQLVRVALSLSAITGVPVHIYNIRANRVPKGRLKAGRGGDSHGNFSGRSSAKVEGGLKESHLAALQFLAYHCDAYTEGAELNSRELTFIPGAGGTKNAKQKGIKTSLVDFETNTIRLQRPGSTMLILQAILPFLIFGRSRHFLGNAENKGQRGQEVEGPETKFELTIHGGTNVSKSMSGEYVKDTLLPILRQIGIGGIEVEVVNRGWAGNVASTVGEVKVRVPYPSVSEFSLPAFDLVDRGEIESISVAMVGDMGLPKEFFEKSLFNAVTEHIGVVPVSFETVDDSGDRRRFYLQVVAHAGESARLSRDFLGTGKMPKNQAEAERMAYIAIQTVVRELKADLKRNGCVDEFMQDQLVVFQALASGESRVDGGKWKTDLGKEDEECGDDEGSLHTRTVRWVCERMLGKMGTGVKFTSGGRCQGVGWNSQEAVPSS